MKSQLFFASQKCSDILKINSKILVKLIIKYIL